MEDSCAGRCAYLKSKSLGGVRINIEYIAIDSLQSRLPVMGVDGAEREVSIV